MSTEATATPARRSWLRAVADARQLGALSFGLLCFVALTSVFGVWQLGASLLGDAGGASEARVAVIHIAIVSYLMAAFVHATRRGEESLRDVAGRLDAGPERQRLLDTSDDRNVLLAAGLAGVALWTIATLLSPGDNWFDPRTWNAPVTWHRALGISMGVVSARLGVLLVLQSARLSRLAAHIRDPDLLDLSGFEVFTRQGLTNALLILGFAAVFSLFAMDPGYLGLAAGTWLLASGTAAAGLLLPLLGTRRRIQEAKRKELAWCRARLRDARGALAEGRPGARIDELLAWETRIDGIREWPLDTTAWRRFGLYLLIPLGSWSAAALVERAIDRVLG